MTQNLSPFTEAHQMFRKTVRDFCERELRPHMDQWEEDELFPRWVFEKAGELEPFVARLGASTVQYLRSRAVPRAPTD